MVTTSDCFIKGSISFGGRPAESSNRPLEGTSAERGKSNEQSHLTSPSLDSSQFRGSAPKICSTRHAILEADGAAPLESSGEAALVRCADSSPVPCARRRRLLPMWRLAPLTGRGPGTIGRVGTAGVFGAGSAGGIRMICGRRHCH